MSSPLGSLVVSQLGVFALVAPFVVGAMLLHWWSGILGFFLANLMVGFLRGKVPYLDHVGTMFFLGLALVAASTALLLL
jgi:hypothetical protein